VKHVVTLGQAMTCDVEVDVFAHVVPPSVVA
jgi:hypothetical protein